jgi:hypothetical protein
MAPLSSRTFSPMLALGLAGVPMLALGLAGASAACGSDVVESTGYPIDQGDDGGGSSGSNGGGSSSGTQTGSSSGTQTGSSSGTQTGSSSGTQTGSSSSTSGSGSGSSGAAATCNVSGDWLVVQHTVAVSDGFKEVSHFYYYYNLSQTGSTVTVVHGLHCGISVVADPANPLGGGDTVTVSSATSAALLARQDEGQAYGSVPARTGTMTMTSGGCQFHLNKYYIVRGATIPYYLDPSNAMSDSMPVASGCGSSFSGCTTPGSEDWDNDGNPGITLNVSGTATGNIYAAQRDFSEYYGTVPLGATKFEVGIVDPTTGDPAVGPEQYALGYGNGCSGICGLSSMVDTCPSSGCAAEFFVDWVKLDSAPASTNAGLCSYVISNAASVAPRATDPSSVPTEAKY